MIALGLASDVEASAIGDRGAVERGEPVTLEEFGAVALFSMGDHAENLHGNTHLGIDSCGGAASCDVLGERPYVAVVGMYDVKRICSFLSARGDRAWQKAQRYKQQ